MQQRLGWLWSLWKHHWHFWSKRACLMGWPYISYRPSFPASPAGQHSQQLGGISCPSGGNRLLKHCSGSGVIMECTSSAWKPLDPPSGSISKGWHNSSPMLLVWSCWQCVRQMSYTFALVSALPSHQHTLCWTFYSRLDDWGSCGAGIAIPIMHISVSSF